MQQSVASNVAGTEQMGDRMSVLLRVKARLERLLDDAVAVLENDHGCEREWCVRVFVDEG
jgi:hypothetical protein